MSTDVYRFKLTENVGNHTILILVNDWPGPFNDWEEGKPISGCLIEGGGKLKTDDAGQHCVAAGSDTVDILILRNASWDTKPGDQGDAELFAYTNSSPYYTWELIDITQK
ncbi:hypothetical protein NKH95_01710 [Mesorhizobium sp. M0848]|uniref:hypothetical protein n=1 Tax=Mesorhizobium sp. M0848 TaxID=2957012 RepID=UPI00333965EB